MGRHKPMTEVTTKDVLAILGGQVRTARTNQQWSHTRLTALAGCSPCMIVSLETGSPTASIGTAIKVMRALEIPLFGTDDPVGLVRLKAPTRRCVALLLTRVYAETKLDDDFQGQVMGVATQSIAVWAWPMSAARLVVAGRLAPSLEEHYSFVYGKSYLDHPLAYALQPGLPLEEGEFIAPSGLEMHGVFRDVLPGGQGQNMVDYQHGNQPQSLETYMLESGPNRLGNLDFQASLSQYVPRPEDTDMQALEADTQLLLSQHRLSRVAGLALVHGTSIGGAKPKIATAREITKLSASDTGVSVRREAFATLPVA